MPLNKFLPLLFLLIPIASFCQPEDKDYKTVLTLKKIGKAYRTASKTDTSWKTYLGVITDRNNQIKYHVVKEFYKNQVASTWHGHSYLYFFDVHKKLKAIYNAVMPDDLPEDKGVIKTHTQRVKVPMDKLFCPVPDGCDVINFLP